jgi:hypothetical protein
MQLEINYMLHRAVGLFGIALLRSQTSKTCDIRWNYKTVYTRRNGHEFTTIFPDRTARAGPTGGPARTDL